MVLEIMELESTGEEQVERDVVLQLVRQSSFPFGHSIGSIRVNEFIGHRQNAYQENSFSTSHEFTGVDS